MKYIANIKNIIRILIIYSIIFVTSEDDIISTIVFKEAIQSIILSKDKSFLYIANYELTQNHKYLYLYPKNYENKLNTNNATTKIYFKQISDKNTDSNLN